MEFKTIELKESIFANNDREADRLRAELKGEKTFLLNLMSSPGSGKTTTLLRTVERLREEMRIGVMEADIDSDVDARTMAGAGVRSIQLHTGGMCHLDAGMTEQGLREIGGISRSAMPLIKEVTVSSSYVVVKEVDSHRPKVFAGGSAGLPVRSV